MGSPLADADKIRAEPPAYVGIICREQSYGGSMFVDSDLLRMGAGFAQSAGTTAEQGATQLSNVQLPSGIFGDFDAAHNFQRALAKAHESHVTTMQGYRAGLDVLSERAISAARTFTAEDESSETAIDEAGCRFA